MLWGNSGHYPKGHKGWGIPTSGARHPLAAPPSSRCSPSSDWGLCENEAPRALRRPQMGPSWSPHAFLPSNGCCSAECAALASERLASKPLGAGVSSKPASLSLSLLVTSHHPRACRMSGAVLLIPRPQRPHCNLGASERRARPPHITISRQPLTLGSWSLGMRGRVLQEAGVGLGNGHRETKMSPEAIVHKAS